MTSVVQRTLTSRSRTRPGRLRLLDVWVAAREALAEGALFVDVGLGHHPFTTLEAAERLAGRRVLGVDTDPRWVDRARASARPPALSFGFPREVARDSAHLVRAMNVLRGAPHPDLPHALAAWGTWLDPGGGVLYEGTASATGDVLVASRFVRTGDRLRRDGLLFATDFSRGFHPHLLRDHLPRELRGHRHARPLDRFFAAWRATWTRARRPRSRACPRELFRACARRLAQDQWSVATPVLPRGQIWPMVPRTPPGFMFWSSADGRMGPALDLGFPLTTGQESAHES